MYTLFMANKASEDISKKLYTLFTIVKETKMGGYHCRVGAWVYFFSIDSGAQIQCISKGILTIFPDLKVYL